MIFRNIENYNEEGRSRSSLYFRVVINAFMILMLMSWSALFAHVSTTVHIHDGVSGGIVHLSAASIVDVPLHVSSPKPEHLECCHALDYAALSTMPIPSVTKFEVSPPRVVISQEVALRQLDIVYLSQRALSRAPKNSPPCISFV